MIVVVLPARIRTLATIFKACQAKASEGVLDALWIPTSLSLSLSLFPSTIPPSTVNPVQQVDSRTCLLIFAIAKNFSRSRTLLDQVSR